MKHQMRVAEQEHVGACSCRACERLRLHEHACIPRKASPATAEVIENLDFANTLVHYSRCLYHPFRLLSFPNTTKWYDSERVMPIHNTESGFAEANLAPRSVVCQYPQETWRLIAS